MSTIAGHDLGVVRPGVVQQLVAAEDLAAVPEQALEQRELARAEVDPQPVDGHDPAGLVERDRPGDQRPAAAPAPRAPRRPSARTRADSSSIANGLTR